MDTSGTRDPRGIITPHAFEVDPSLMGTPLATPRRRLAALGIDGLVIGFITAVTSSFALVLGVVAAALFVRAGFKKTPVRGSVFGRAMRFSVGCLGLVIGGITAIVWTAVGFAGGDGSPVELTVDGVPVEGMGSAGEVIEALAAVGLASAFENVESLEEAEEVSVALLSSAEDLGLRRERVAERLLAAIPEDASWAEEAPAMISALLAAEPVAAPASATTDGGEASEPLGPAAQDSLRALRSRISLLERENREQSLELRAAEAEARPGLFERLRGLLDELGFGFGWAALYMTVILSWWNGQTVGKKMMGIRVVRLDGGPVTWWVAFERAGGYAAGLATGLLGFAQVWWDANRQTIHDRIVGTVVIRDGAPKVEDWESAL
jgi:uncharacterized RDD family membrane protein YckC